MIEDMEQVRKEDTVTGLYDFSQKVYLSFVATPFHEAYYRVLDAFARRRIRKLIVSIPPQHGKSLGSSVLLPAYMLGLDRDLKIAIASYSSSLANRFNRRIQRIIDLPRYGELFPGTKIKSIGAKSESIRTASRFEVLGHAGELYSIGREGSLTGNEVDIFILDDLYKDAMEANSPIIRDNCWEWYTSVVRSRMHNDSSELIVFTRWHEEDLIGTLMSKEKYVVLENWDQLESLRPDQWLVVNFKALKDDPATEVDQRLEGEALWAKRHSAKLLIEKRDLDPHRFNCMYQGVPSPQMGLLYSSKIRTYTEIPENIVRKSNYTDTADLGDDYLCSVCYEVDTKGLIYITDIVYSRESMEVTEEMVADMLLKNKTRQAYIESNNGGRGFARAVSKLAPKVNIEWFHQSGNKEARILSNSATVLKNILMPDDWSKRWSDFYIHLITYRRPLRANRWHDAPDVLTGIVEKEIVENMSKRIRLCRK